MQAVIMEFHETMFLIGIELKSDLECCRKPFCQYAVSMELYVTISFSDVLSNSWRAAAMLPARESAVMLRLARYTSC